ncbi:MAG: hypothetical protein OER22_09720 [Gammaproteobacteria bacterium]|nr:hypothetical protein [Gammaproteobacteria bacterium]MDH3408170.1 hypothetical protein [Gammaproteobacteria bacterium]MDH3552876.1 hypothetical protein [Gammaproteobacteria bacterium]
MKITTAPFISIALLFSAISVQAGVQRYVSGTDLVVFDDVAGIAWMADMSDTSTVYSMDYNVQLGVVSNMNAAAFHGLRGWHIATETELDSLVQNPLSELANNFNLSVFGNTAVASGRYENSINPAAANKHHLFTLTRLACCEPYPSGWPYEETIVQPGQDIFLFAAPDPITGNPDPNTQTPDTNAFGFGAWVATSQVYLKDGQLIPKRCFTTFLGRTVCLNPVPMLASIVAILTIIIFGTYFWRRRKKHG